MKKSDKKIENSLREALTEVCDIALDNVVGFQWITHLVDYSRLPSSLKVVCVFETEDQLATVIAGSDREYLADLIQQKLKAVGIELKDMKKQLRFDTEEACRVEHGGKWHERFNIH